MPPVPSSAQQLHPIQTPTVESLRLKGKVAGQVRTSGLQNYKRIQNSRTFFCKTFIIFTILTQAVNPNTIINMSNLSSSENQSSSQFSKQEEEPGLNSLEMQLQGQLDPEVASVISAKVANCLKSNKKDHFAVCFRIVAKLIEKGYGKEVAKFNAILQGMMDGFCAMTKEIEASSDSEFQVMCLLSVIAELIKQAPQLQVSMKKKFLQSLLLIDEELLGVSPLKKNILAVLGVLYECISKQTKALKKFQLLKQFKKAILSNYSLIEQHFSCRLFNKALYNLAIQGQSLSEAELHKHGVFSTLSKIMGHEQAAAIIMKIKSALQKLAGAKDTPAVGHRTEMVAQSRA